MKAQPGWHSNSELILASVFWKLVVESSTLSLGTDKKLSKGREWGESPFLSDKILSSLFSLISFPSTNDLLVTNRVEKTRGKRSPTFILAQLNHINRSQQFAPFAALPASWPQCASVSTGSPGRSVPCPAEEAHVFSLGQQHLAAMRCTRSPRPGAAGGARVNSHLILWLSATPSLFFMSTNL